MNPFATIEEIVLQHSTRHMDKIQADFFRSGMSSIQVSRFELRVLTLKQYNASAVQPCIVRRSRYIVTVLSVRNTISGSFRIQQANES